MRLEVKETVKDYFETIQEKYPNLTLEQCKEVITTPFEMVKEDMENAEFSTCRLKYLGTFFVYPKKAKAALEGWTKMFKSHKIDRTEYFELKSKIEKYIEEHEEN